LLDAKLAKDYYSDTNAGTYLVYPFDGKRIDNGQIWGMRELYNNTWSSHTVIETRLYCYNGNLYAIVHQGGGTLYEKSTPFVLIYNQRGGTFAYSAPGTGTHNIWDGTYANYHVWQRFGAYPCPSCYMNVIDWH